MYFLRKKRVIKFLIFILSAISFFKIKFYFPNDKPLNDKSIFDKTLISNCSCIRDKVSIKIRRDYVNIEVTDIQKNQQKLRYQIKIKDYKRLKLTCDPYKVLRRGFNQKIISFSLYGKDTFYYRLVEENVARAFKFYPSWTVRIYHDNSINPEFICKLECLYSDNVDFCDVKNMPGKVNLDYMLPMTWRWLPIGDSFVKLFISRDTDSCIFDREVSAVNEWLKSNKLFHIMRDHPSHEPKILGGMWGFFIEKNRNLAEDFYNILISRYVSLWYKTVYPVVLVSKGQDQYLLEWYFWSYAKKNSTIHDSYHCHELGGQPFPTQRPPYTNCFVGSIACCGSQFSNKTFEYECEPKCRPPNKINEWIYC